MSQLPSTTPSELKADIDAGEQVTIVDVRQPHEFERGHIEAPSAETVNVPLRQIQTSDPEELLADVSTDEVVAVCRSGNRSSTATQILNQAGIDTKNLEGGMQAWTRLTA